MHRFCGLELDIVAGGGGGGHHSAYDRCQCNLMRNKVLFNKIVLEQLDIYMEKDRISSLFHTICKN